MLPSSSSSPLPSLELSRYLEQDIPETFELQYWQVDCYAAKTWIKSSGFHFDLVTNVVKLLNELHFIAINNLAEVQLGADLLFWYHYTQAFKQVILKDQYIPALKYRQISNPKPTTSGKSKVKSAAKTQQNSETNFEVYPSWELVSELYEADLKRYVDYMPLACVAGFAKPQETSEFYDREMLLRHFSECLLTEIATHTPSTAGFEQKIGQTLLHDCMSANYLSYGKNTGLELYQQWRTWRDRINSVA